MTKPLSKEVVTAYHEAGHAVGAYLLGVPVSGASLSETDDGEGSVRGTLTAQEIRERNLGWEHAVVYTLGFATERLFFGKADLRYLADDVAGRKGAFLTFFPQMSRSDFRVELRRRTADVVSHPKFREAVESLANVILRERTVSAVRAAEVIREVMG